MSSTWGVSRRKQPHEVWKGAEKVWTVGGCRSAALVCAAVQWCWSWPCVAELKLSSPEWTKRTDDVTRPEEGLLTHSGWL
jgi:hypothetical protein